MADMREELAAAIAEKYNELEELAQQAGAYGAIRLDWARYGEDGLDAILETFRAGLEDFDRQLEGVMSDGDYVRAALENIMDEREMDDEQRARFLSTVKTFAGQSGMTRLKYTLSGESDNVVRALVSMSAEAGCGDDCAHADEVLDEICREAQREQDAAARLELHSVSGETAEELLRCYAAYCVLRDGKAEGMRLDDDGLRFIGTTVRAGQKQSDVLRDGRAGRLTGEQVAEVLRAIAEVLLVALALFVSGAMGVYAAMSVVHLVGMLLGFTGALGGAALALGIVCALPAGVKVTCDMLKLCARAGVWLEKTALEPGAAKVEELFDGGCRWFGEQVAPAVKQGWNNACAAGRGVYENARPQLENMAESARQGANRVWEGVKPQLDKAADGTLGWMEHAAGELNGALDRLMSAFRVSDPGKV